jgi:predicted O-linked N-acetylglucosamine transferase (SPINDLY family)
MASRPAAAGAADGAVLAQAAQQAGRLYHAGDWVAAERGCRLILGIDGDHFGALTLLGIVLARTQRLPEAADLLARAVQLRPDDATGLNNYGQLLRDLGRLPEALERYERALTLRPDYAEAHNNRGNALHFLGRFDEALASYERALALKGDYPEALNNRGVTLQALRRSLEALESFGRALNLRPDYAESCYNCGNALRSLARPAEALASYERALTLKSDFVEAHYNRANALRELGRAQEALAGYDEALRLRPDFAEAWSNRGTALKALGRLDEALQSYQRALEIKPDAAESHNNRGNTLAELQRYDEALESYTRALGIDPAYAEANNNCGSACRELGRLQQALQSYERALECKPDFAEACSNRAGVLKDLGRLEEAAAAYQQALQLRSGCEWAYGAWLHARLHLCDWRGLEEQIAELARRVSRHERATPPFPLLTLTDDLALHRRAAEIWTRDAGPKRTVLPPLERRPPRERIRIGYYSADFRAHAVPYLIVELFERHDRRRFELVGLSFGPHSTDGMRQRIAAGFDRFIDVRLKTDREIAELSRELQIDIAVDLMGFTANERAGIFAHRAAPIQVNYLGYPGTMAAPYIDYLIADRVLIPENARQHYSEKIVYLPYSYQPNDRKRQIADRHFSREELGLPPEGFVFCCFNNTFKIAPQIFDLWMRLLREMPGSVLWLLEDRPTAAENLRREAQARSVDPHRLVFARRMHLPEHLARHRCADLFLDTLPYNAHTTASDALWAGLPVLTCMGQSFAARVAGSLLSAIGLPELITHDVRDYEARARELAGDPAQLAALRTRLQANRLTTPLFDSTRFARHIEQAYTRMYERHQAHLDAEHLYVPP